MRVDLIIIHSCICILLSLCAPLSVYASIGSDEFCAQNEGHFACDNENDNDSDDDGKSDAQGIREDNEDETWNESCYDSGYRAGQNGPFSQETHDHCGDEEGGDDAYMEGFVNGCLDVGGNTRDVCISATDA